MCIRQNVGREECNYQEARSRERQLQGPSYGTLTVLLLNKATSTLNEQSEQVVQKALDQIMVGQTMIVVAQRNNTIKDLDSIALVTDGKLVERGTYAQLMNNRGAVFNLTNQ